jgi:hypothetical protein
MGLSFFGHVNLIHVPSTIARSMLCITIWVSSLRSWAPIYPSIVGQNSEYLLAKIATVLGKKNRSHLRGVEQHVMSKYVIGPVFSSQIVTKPISCRRFF